MINGEVPTGGCLDPKREFNLMEMVDDFQNYINQLRICNMEMKWEDIQMIIDIHKQNDEIILKGDE